MKPEDRHPSELPRLHTLVPVIAMSTNTSRFVSPALFALLLNTAPALAQIQSNLRAWGGIPVDSGAILRITIRDGSMTEGRLIAKSPEGVTMERTDGLPFAASTTIRGSAISAVEVRTSSRQGRKGAVVGVVAGAVGGLVAATLGCASYSGRPSENMCGLGYIFLPPVFGFIGVVAGAVIGSTQHEESWSPVPAPSD